MRVRLGIVRYKEIIWVLFCAQNFLRLTALSPVTVTVADVCEFYAGWQDFWQFLQQLSSPAPGRVEIGQLDSCNIYFILKKYLLYKELGLFPVFQYCSCSVTILIQPTKTNFQTLRNPLLNILVLKSMTNFGFFIWYQDSGYLLLLFHKPEKVESSELS